MEYHTALGRKINQLSREAGLTPPKLAARMRARGHPIYESTQRKIEKGERRVQCDEAVSYAEILGIPLWRLLGQSREEAAWLEANYRR